MSSVFSSLAPSIIETKLGNLCESDESSFQHRKIAVDVICTFLLKLKESANKLNDHLDESLTVLEYEHSEILEGLEVQEKQKFCDKMLSFLGSLLA